MPNMPRYHRLPFLRDPEALFFQILDEVPDMAIWLDADGRIVYANAKACRCLGYTREELLGGGIALIVPSFSEDDYPDFFEDLRRRKSTCFELDHHTKAGGSFPAEVRVSHVTLEGLELACALVMDISRRRKAEDQTLDLHTASMLREAKLRALIQEAQGGAVRVEDLEALLQG